MVMLTYIILHLKKLENSELDHLFAQYVVKRKEYTLTIQIMKSGMK